MLELPIVRAGKAYESVEKIEIVHHATGEVVARVNQANSGMITRDIGRMDSGVLDRFTVAQLMELSRKAGELFVSATLPCGNQTQSFDDYICHLSATTGMPVTLCRNNAQKIRRIFVEIDRVLAGLTRGFDLSILDRGYGDDGGRTLSYFREARVFGAVLPSNSPGVHSLWIPAICLKTPVALKPGREEPWTPLRVIEAFTAAGVPREAFGFYPTDHGGAAALLRAVDRSMLFGDSSTTKPWANDPQVELHGPGYSKIVLGEDCVDHWEKYVDVMVSSIVANGGRSCINASAIWTPRHGEKIAAAVASELAKVQALPVEHPDAKIAAFANAATAEAINNSIEAGLTEAGATDLTLAKRGSGRLVKQGRIAYLLPTIVWIDPKCPACIESGPAGHSLANREFLFPFASVIECPTEKMPEAIGSSLIVTAITHDKHFQSVLMACGDIDRLNIGAVPTYQLSWDQPHEGNLFEHLYRQRAFQMEPAA